MQTFTLTTRPAGSEYTAPDRQLQADGLGGMGLLGQMDEMTYGELPTPSGETLSPQRTLMCSQMGVHGASCRAAGGLKTALQVRSAKSQLRFPGAQDFVEPEARNASSWWS